MNLKLGDYKFQLIIFSTIITTIIKILFSNNNMLIFLTTIFEFALILLIYLILENFTKSPIKNILFYSIFILNLLISIITSYFLDMFNYRKGSLFLINLNTASFFFKKILSIQQLLIGILVLISIFLIPFLLKTKKQYKLKNNITNIIIIILLIIIVFIPILAPNTDFSNVYINTYKSIKSTLFNPRISINPIGEYNYSFLDRSISNYSKITIPKNQRIIVFVMETVTNDYMEVERNKLNKDDDFFRRIENHSKIYTNYYTTNQDSRTAIISMLSSFFIPFESYIDNWEEAYEHKIFTKKNLINLFNKNNYSTIYAISSSTPPVLKDLYHWKNTTYIQNFEKANNEFYCFDQYEFEKACEDKAIFEDLKKIIKNQNNLFLLQELVFGHNLHYEIDNKESRFKYYNDYFNKFYDYLEKNNLLENTTLIFLGDHGGKAETLNFNTKEFQVPLIIFDKKKIPNKIINTNLHSHLDFKDILLNILNKTNKVNQNQEFDDYFLIVGNTGSNIIANIGNDESGILNTKFNKLTYYSNKKDLRTQIKRFETFYKYKNSEFNSNQTK